LAEKIDFTFTDREPARSLREEMLKDVAILGAGHRGQLGKMIENSITPPADRFTTYLHRAEASSRRPPAGSNDTDESPLAENCLAGTAK
jgi:hypothetical protein